MSNNENKSGVLYLYDENNQLYKQYSLKKKEDIKELMNDCENQLHTLREKEKKEKDSSLKSSRPLKTKIRDLEKFDPIFVVETYPITEDFKEGYRILKCYISSVSHEKDEETGELSMSVSIQHDEHGFGVYGEYIPEESFDKPYQLDVYISARFYTLDIDNWERDFVAAYSSKFHEMRQETEKEINNHKEIVAKFIAKKHIITRLLKEQSEL